MFKQLEASSPHFLAALRIVAGVLFLAHGVVKLFGFPEGAQPGQVEILSLFGIGAILELVGGSLLVLGAFTRPVAFILAGEMAVAYWMFHFPSSPYPAVNGGDAAILFCFIFLYLLAAGPGSWSLDARLRKQG
ncbi:DoxX family protein [Brevundimonas sp. SL130]|uniref:DoxX family protein n=1 Tax=Brevundimonas sp. SL130 TaxID=2995143 RepID=UPI00226D15A1|nr:DoxX family protein [Brevundimonas sp. SL130]WAC58536.1 DoxX family protein [Brevundimonas sp. SL130]